MMVPLKPPTDAEVEAMMAATTPLAVAASIDHRVAVVEADLDALIVAVLS